MLITKADGSREDFKPAKLRRSLRNAGAHRHEITTIVTEIESMLTEGMKTQAIYRKAFELLRKSERPIAAKYSLRRALFGLGPTGFPFEDFLARLFEEEGFSTRVRTHVKGTCANHEIDIAAFSPEYSFVAEAKFHMRPGIKSDLQVALYSYARFLDLKTKRICKDDQCGIEDLVVVTNTKFTQTAVQYAKCTGINLLSWDYPRNNSLQQRVERAHVYPITALTNLTNTEKKRLLDMSIILCRDVLKNPEILSRVNVRNQKKAMVLDEAKRLCSQ